MSQSLSKGYVHITFSTKKRYPFIDNAIEQELWAYIGGVCKELECNPIRVGGCNEHIHMKNFIGKTVTEYFPSIRLNWGR